MAKKTQELKEAQKQELREKREEKEKKRAEKKSKKEQKERVVSPTPTSQKKGKEQAPTPINAKPKKENRTPQNKNTKAYGDQVDPSFPCLYGTECRKRGVCPFKHPDLKVACRHGSKCTRHKDGKCKFYHDPGTFTIVEPNGKEESEVHPPLKEKKQRPHTPKTGTKSIKGTVEFAGKETTLTGTVQFAGKGKQKTQRANKNLVTNRGGKSAGNKKKNWNEYDPAWLRKLIDLWKADRYFEDDETLTAKEAYQYITTHWDEIDTNEFDERIRDLEKEVFEKESGYMYHSKISIEPHRRNIGELFSGTHKVGNVWWVGPWHVAGFGHYVTEDELTHVEHKVGNETKKYALTDLVRRVDCGTRDSVVIWKVAMANPHLRKHKYEEVTSATFAMVVHPDGKQDQAPKVLRQMQEGTHVLTFTSSGVAGDCMAPLVDGEGRVIGWYVGVVTGKNISLAVPAVQAIQDAFADFQ